MSGSDWPMIMLGMPQANSTPSMPRCTEARASTSVLPCSRVTSRASSSNRWLSNSRKRKSTRQRSTTGVADQAGSAAAAARTTSSTSALSARGTVAMTWPVEGLKTSDWRELPLVCHLPLQSMGTVTVAVDDEGAVVDGIRYETPEESGGEITLYKYRAAVMLTLFGTRSRAMDGFRNPTAPTPPGPHKSPVIVAKSLSPANWPRTRFVRRRGIFTRPRHRCRLRACDWAGDLSRKNAHERSRPQA